MVPRESPTAAGDQESVAATPSPDRRGNMGELCSGGEARLDGLQDRGAPLVRLLVRGDGLERG